MPDPQDAYPNDLAEMEAWVRSFVEPGMRVLEIGAGDGALTRRLASDLDIVGVDPHAADVDGVRPIAFEDLDESPFDVVCASVSLHHLHDLDAAAVALHRLTRPGSVLLVRELDRALSEDEATLRWWFHQRHARRTVEQGRELPPMSDSFETFAAEMKAKLDGHVHYWPAVEAMIVAAGFAEEERAATAYLFRWGLTEDVRPIEERLIAEGAIKAVGIRWRGLRA